MDDPLSPESNEKVRLLQGEVEQVKGIMKENVVKATQNFENVDELEQKTRDLEAGSITFRQKAKKAKWQMIWENWKCYLAVVGVLLVIILIIILACMPSKTS